MAAERAVGLYLHIPFCHARCGYCDFVTFTGKEDRIDEYVLGLCQEIRLYAREGAQRCAPTLQIATVFFGGGTPSLLEPHHVRRILDAVRRHFALDPDAEITLEANPESLTGQKAEGWRLAGINRLSIGLQAFDDKLLKAMGRLHTAEQFRQAYQTVRQADFTNVNIDLIYGFVGQTFESWQSTLKEAAALAPEHLSLYALTIEEHTPFGVAGLQVDEDLQAEMYEWARTYLRGQGFEQYEISNFARGGQVCRHNLIYWRQQDYVGLGVGAVGCVSGLRWENHKNLQVYQKDISSGRFPRASVEVLESKTRRFERLMLRLRLREGLEWGEENNPDWLTHRSSLTARNFLEEVRPGAWRIPDHAVALTNQILLPFVP